MLPSNTANNNFVKPIINHIAVNFPKFFPAELFCYNSVFLQVAKYGGNASCHVRMYVYIHTLRNISFHSYIILIVLQ